jgi:hypothetical protein
VAQLDDSRFQRVEFRKAVERLVERQQFSRLFGGERGRLFERECIGPAAALPAHVAARVVNEDAAHQLRRNSEEVRAVVPAGMGLVDQLEVDLVDEGGGLERVRGVFTPHVALGEAAQLALDERDQAVERRRVAVAQSNEHVRHALGSNHFLPSCDLRRGAPGACKKIMSKVIGVGGFQRE